MNLQLCVPYQKCAYSCPMCVARNHKHGSNFENLYRENPGKFMARLLKVINNPDFDIQDIVFTGECDPTQNMGFVKFCISALSRTHKFRGGKNLEFQTHNLNLSPEMFTVDDHRELRVETISYSVIKPDEYMNSWSYWNGRWAHSDKSKSRMVILLTDAFSFLNKDIFSDMGFDQVTFKALQHGECEKTNRWIDENKMRDDTKIREIVDAWNGDATSVRLDTSCQNAQNRYYVFRSDGNLYDSWESTNPIL